MNATLSIQSLNDLDIQLPRRYFIGAQEKLNRGRRIIVQDAVASLKKDGSLCRRRQEGGRIYECAFVGQFGRFAVG